MRKITITLDISDDNEISNVIVNDRGVTSQLESFGRLTYRSWNVALDDDRLQLVEWDS